MSSLNEYNNKLAKLLEKIGDQAGDFWYRGQRNANWPLRSGAIGRLTDKKIEVEELIGYHEDLLESVKLIKTPNKRQLRDLELLAQLQHYGAATCLLDMTSNFNIALWFACQKAKKNTRSGIEGAGRVFIVPTNPANTQVDFLKINSDELGATIRYFLDPETKRKTKKQVSHEVVGSKKPRFWCWEPRPLMSRVLSQSSRFIIGSEDIPERLYDSIEIAETHKEDLLLELEQQQGLKPQNIFSDIPGLAIVNARDIPHRLKQYRVLLRAGRKKIQEGNFEGAVEDLNRADKLETDNPNILLARGEALTKWVNYDGYQLGRKRSWKTLERAEDDLMRVRNIAKNTGKRELQNQVNEKLKELRLCEDNLEDYLSVMEMEDTIMKLNKIADKEHFGKRRRVPIVLAATFNQIDAASYLIKNGADVNQQGPRDKTALHLAAARGHYQMCEMLLQAGADVNAEAYGGDPNSTPLDFAKVSGKPEIKELLLNWKNRHMDKEGK